MVSGCSTQLRMNPWNPVKIRDSGGYAEPCESTKRGIPVAEDGGGGRTLVECTEGI